MKINRTNKKHRLGKGHRCNKTTNAPSQTAVYKGLW